MNRPLRSLTKVLSVVIFHQIGLLFLGTVSATVAAAIYKAYLPERFPAILKNWKEPENRPLRCAGKLPKRCIDAAFNAMYRTIDMSRYIPQASHIVSRVFMFASAMAVTLLIGGGCKSTTVRNVLPEKRLKIDSSGSAPATIKGPELPDIEEFSLALKEYETRSDIQFFRNSRGRYMIYFPSGPDHFSIADVAGACLYDVKITPSDKEGASKEAGGRPAFAAVAVSQTACGLTSPFIDPLVMSRLISSAEKLVFPALEGRLTGGPWLRGCSDINFVQQVLNAPFDIGDSKEELEKWLASTADTVEDPFDLSLGDIIFAGAPDRALVGIYAGYGLVVLNSGCDSASVHRLRSDLKYRVYRLYNGFSWSRYKVRDEYYLGDHLDKSG